MGVRKNILFMPSDERELFFEALLKLKANIVNPNDPVADQYSVYDQFTSLALGRVRRFEQPERSFLQRRAPGACVSLGGTRPGQVLINEHEPGQVNAVNCSSHTE